MNNRWLKLRKYLQTEMGLFPVAPPPAVQKPPSDQIVINGHTVTILFVPNRKARNYIMRFRDNGVLRVTVPRMGSMRQARAFVSKNRDWIMKHYDKVVLSPKPQKTWENGSILLFRGEPTPLHVTRDESGHPVLAFAQYQIKLRGDSEHGDFRPVIESYLKQIAAKELPAQLAQLAHTLGVQFSRVTIRAQRTRWGSCSTRKTISLNWRLIHTPPFVQEYILIHELMHLREMNHSRRFWQQVETACPDYRKAEKWLNDNKVLGTFE